MHTKVTLDSNWRWLHADGEAVNCYTGNLWDEELCPDPETCSENCVLGLVLVKFKGCKNLFLVGGPFIFERFFLKTHLGTAKFYTPLMIQNYRGC